MQITGIEVIKHNPGAAVGVITGEKVELTYGDTLRVNVSFDYRGPAQTVTLYGSIGIRAPLAFNEILFGQVDIELPESLTDFTPCERRVDIAITSDISPGTDYDLYCKFVEYPGEGMPEVDNVIDIVGIPPTYELIYHNVYPLAYIYEDEVDFSVFSFTIPTYAGEWWGEPIANALYNEIKKQGGQVLELKVHADTSAILWTNFKIEVRGVLPGEGVSGVAAIPLWAAILIAALAIIGIILIVTWSIKTIHALFSPPEPLSEEIKAPWKRETLISAATDYEEYLGQPITPPETLEGMSDQELRDYLDELAKEVVPPVPVSWWPLAIVGGLCVLGVGAAVALAARPKE